MVVVSTTCGCSRTVDDVGTISSRHAVVSGPAVDDDVDHNVGVQTFPTYYVYRPLERRIISRTSTTEANLELNVPTNDSVVGDEVITHRMVASQPD